MISHHYKCIFIHIPKNAGQSIERIFLNLLNLDWEARAPLLLRYNEKPDLGPPRLAHLKADEYVKYNYVTQDIFDSYYKFAFVRNPWDRVVSMYKYMGFNRKMGFKAFLTGEFKNNLFKNMYWFVGPQSEFLFNKNDEILVDFIGKFEELQNGFDLVAKEIGIPSVQLPHFNASREYDSPQNLKEKMSEKYPAQGLPQEKASNRKAYREFYDSESMTYIADLYSEDIDLFEYSF